MFLLPQEIKAKVRYSKQHTFPYNKQLSNGKNLNMRVVKIPKRIKGQFREIGIPNRREKFELKLLVPVLNELLLKYSKHDIIHGFIKYKSPVSNATKHIGFQYTLKLDLKDFFDTVKIEQTEKYYYDPIIYSFIEEFRKKIESAQIFFKDRNGKNILISNNPFPNLRSLINKPFINGRAYQGLPTSPLIANLAALGLDEDIYQFIKSLDNNNVYTRYADDLTVSFNDYNFYKPIKDKILELIIKHGFVVNSNKIHLQSAKFGYRRITGVMVGENNIKPTRRIKKIIRAIEFKHHIIGEEFGSIKTSYPYGMPHKDADRFEGLVNWSKNIHPKYPPGHFKRVVKGVLDYLRVSKIIQIKNSFDKTFENYYDQLRRSDTVETAKTIIKNLYFNKMIKPSNVRMVNNAIEKLEEDKINT